MPGRRYYVYILASKNRAIYIGVTSNLFHRTWQHKNKKPAGFTSQYNIDRLVYYEEFKYVREAIAREKELKGWRRAKKLALINQTNLTWDDLAANWYEGVPTP